MLSDAVRRAHAAAVEAAEPGYFDPQTGFFVFTEAALPSAGRVAGADAATVRTNAQPFLPDLEVPDMTSSTPDERLRALGLTLPDAPASPPGHAPRPIEPLVVHDSIVFFSGVAPLDVTGVVGTDLTVEQAYEVAGTLALMAMRRIVDAFGSLDAVERWIKVLAFVRSAPGFGDQPAVVNGFSDRVIEVYGTERGRCACSAIGVSDLPRQIPIEIEAIVALRAG